MIKIVIGLFLFWRLGLFFISFLSVLLIPWFDGRFPYYDTELLSTNLPLWLTGFGNFDGVHYLRIAKMGYESSRYSQAFFPLYPTIISLFTFNGNYFLTAFIISNIFFLAGLYLLYRLWIMDYGRRIVVGSILLLILFPTSYYFGAIYSESLFLFLTAASLYLLRNKSYIGAGIYAGFASATRIVGIFLIPVFLVEIFLLVKKGEFHFKRWELVKTLAAVFLASLGFLFYLYYLQTRFGSPFYFLSSQPLFGAERTGGEIILLPQIFYRYLKMIFSTPLISLSFFNIFLELTFTIISLFLLVFSFKKIRLSYWLFTFGCLILPTLTGTFSSMPRYSLMSFLLFPPLVQILGERLKWLLVPLFLTGIVLLSLFLRGYWVA